MSSAEFIYLASQSPRRRQLLEQLQVRHALLLPQPGEDAESLEAWLEGESPYAYVQRVTRLKLDAALVRRRSLGLAAAPVLCSDTTVALRGQVYGKPQDAADACRMLAELSGTEHEVLTAVALSSSEPDADEAPALALSVSVVRFAPLAQAQIEAYVASGEPMGKAGAYAIQGRAAAFIEHISGSYTGIMGLPLFETAQLLRKQNVQF
ncbi:MAG: Maf-like protein YhdE [Paracidovorax wautersii]|uniref:dTTP/UTP pyrophosphatase n=1 Tax=Paracidovorax wautersii TaxID=1177982 RepID=A0A7V8FMB1_9BURK|nr:MAG: Maf-like protein YhdE [Paracidovorax wautersii]